jgi:2-polyprenyl-3-methyl-5-hydroxy-6-metoxy-1,4-benzoquinol methylase
MKNFSIFIKKYLENRPRFFSFIRPQEAQLFYSHIDMMDGPVLDFGCGDGFFADIIFKKKFIDVGLDLPNSRINEAKKVNIYKSLVTYDGDIMPFKKNHFGTIISNCVFEHVPNIKQSVEEMQRVLKKNGYLFTSVMCSSWSNNLWGRKLFGQKYVDWFNGIQHHDSLLSKKEWIHLFKDAGFEVVEAIDYLYENTSQKTEIYHFLSIFSLLTYKLFKRWTLFPHASQQTINSTEKIIVEDTKNPSACFFVLKKV